jgi:hypothetical protein
LDPLEITQGTLRALAGQVPVVGPVLTGAFEARAKEVQEAPLREFLEDLRSEFSRLVADAFDRQYLESQDFATWFFSRPNMLNGRVAGRSGDCTPGPW